MALPRRTDPTVTGPAGTARRLIYFSPVPWASYSQRPHFLVRHLLAETVVTDVLWVEPYPTRLPRWADFQQRRRRAPHGEGPSLAHLRRLAVQALPIEPLPGGSTLNRLLSWSGAIRELEAFAREAPCVLGIGRPSALAVWALASLPHRTSFFDAMDDFPAFYGPLSGHSMARRESAVASRVDWVFCSSHPLVGKFRPRAERVVLVPNGYPMAGLPPVLPVRERTAIGYVGSIADWFDWPLVVEMARALPDVPIRLIGPEFVARPADLPRNIEVRPECPREAVVEEVRRFSVGLIPFRRNRLTASVDPIKYYEYAALGVPVWSTAFGEMALRGGEPAVHLVAAGTDWRRLFGTTCATQLSDEFVAEFRKANDWAARFAAIADCLSRPHDR